MLLRVSRLGDQHPEAEKENQEENFLLLSAVELLIEATAKNELLYFLLLLLDVNVIEEMFFAVDCLKYYFDGGQLKN